MASTRLSDDIKARLERIAKLTKRSQSYHTRAALTTYLATMEARLLKDTEATSDIFPDPLSEEIYLAKNSGLIRTGPSNNDENTENSEHSD